jgi:hypothetical protein
MYLGGTLYRIHGTNQPSSIGQKVSSGCIRLLNEDAIDLYNRVDVGTKVVVLPDGPRRAPADVASAREPQGYQTYARGGRDTNPAYEHAERARSAQPALENLQPRYYGWSASRLY